MDPLENMAEHIHANKIQALASQVVDVPSTKCLIEYIRNERIGDALARSIYQHVHFSYSLERCKTDGGESLNRLHQRVFKDMVVFMDEFANGYNKMVAETIGTSNVPVFTATYPTYLDVTDELIGVKEWIAPKKLECSTPVRLMPTSQRMYPCFVQQFRVLV
jgi:hypothetical protein